MKPRRKSSTAAPNADPFPALPDDPVAVDSPATLAWLCKAATGEDEYWANRIRTALTQVGFDVQRLQREEFHPVWVAWLTPGSVDLSIERKLASKQLRKALCKAGLQIRRGELDVVTRVGSKRKVVFIFGRVLPQTDILDGCPCDPDDEERGP